MPACAYLCIRGGIAECDHCLNDRAMSPCVNEGHWETCPVKRAEKKGVYLTEI